MLVDDRPAERVDRPEPDLYDAEDAKVVWLGQRIGFVTMIMRDSLTKDLHRFRLEERVGLDLKVVEERFFLSALRFSRLSRTWVPLAILDGRLETTTSIATIRSVCTLGEC